MGDLELAEDQVIAQTIANWIKTSRQGLADVPTLAQTITDRLIYAVERRVENQVLAGSGQASTMLGILGRSGIQTVAFDNTVPLSDLALDGITAVLTAEAQPNAVIVNPDDRATTLKALATGSGERLDSGGAFAPGVGDSVWDVPTISSTVMPRGQALVGDFTQARLFIREAVNLRISDADQDDFVRNRLTMLAEGRFGIAVWQPAAFCLLVHLAAVNTAAVALTPASIPADGASISDVTVTVTDENGDPLVDQTVTITATNGCTVGPVTGNGDGTYSATLTAGTNTGSSTVTATDGTVHGTATLTLTA